MSNQKLDTLFRDLEQVDGDPLFEDVEGNEKALIDGNRTIGLGLAMVARVVRNMDGQLRLKSEVGKGSRFVIQLPFVLPYDESGNSGNQEKAAFLKTPSMSPSIASPPPAGTPGEVTLVEKSSFIRPNTEPLVSRKRSIEEIASLHSFKSTTSSKVSGKSDVDRLIDAISGPIGSAPGESLQRAASKDRHSLNGMPMDSPNSERPANLKRSASYTSPEFLRLEYSRAAGTEITDTTTPVKAVRMPDEFSGSMNDKIPPVAAKVKFNTLSSSSSQSGNEDELIPGPRTHNTEHLKVLVAEDDPVNSRIINKRLEKGGHEVFHTINGEECASAYGDNVTNSSNPNTSSSPTTRFDVVLMDMQMPIVDGLTSTKMIRSFEKTHLNLSPRAKLNGRVPIFAVSASLVERERQTYIDAGFDGWVLKPIDFKRLNVLLEGIVDSKVREACLYRPGEWERGGWFHKMQPSALQSSTVPSNDTPVQNPPQVGPEAPQPDKDSLDSDTGSSTPRDDKKRPLIYDERLNAASDALNATAEVDVGPINNLSTADERPVTDVSSEEVTPTARQSIMDGANKDIEDITATTIVNDSTDSGPTADSYFGAGASNVDQSANSTTVDGPPAERTNDTETAESTG
ncbi:hypothetical protein EYC84_009730 [Monilinia fructicola]|uniref:Response regulatory domain-containing protein n=1 Tax=Monilinia fructicola TaxID=38448 RepID=A0A5M9JDD2_MONFR|nr:hypothetical protein EYC84_009730 [Monilinia fructicola]